MEMYRRFVRWYPLLDPVEDHRDEAVAFEAAARAVLGSGRHTLLELGAGAGNTASFLSSFERTLTDLSPEMRALSARQNPDCRHLPGDMRTLRLDEQFDVVLVHDAVCYLTTEEDLMALAETLRHHVRPGGVALVAPDCVQSSFIEGSEMFSNDSRDLGLRVMEWMRRGVGSTYVVDYAFLLRDGDDVVAHHERHVEGLFAAETWERVLAAAGARVDRVPRPDAEPPYAPWSFRAVF